MRTMRFFWSRFSGKLTEQDKYQITSWAFSFFMSSNFTITDAVIEAVKKAKPEKVGQDGSLRLSEHDLQELELRVKNML